MSNYLLRRLALLLPVLLGVSLIIFLAMRVIPGDVALMLLTAEGGGGAATPENLAKLRHTLGTDRPVYVQYVEWIGNLVKLNPGVSLQTGRPILDQLKTSVPVTLEVAFLGLFLSLFIALPLGVLSAIYQDTWLDYVFRIVSILGIAMPLFWTGALMIMFTVGAFQWMPQVQYRAPWENLGINLSQVFLPALVLGYYLAAVVSRMTRSCMLEVLREDYIRTARAKGLRERLVVIRHALKNALLPVLTVLGIYFGHLLGGSVVVEMVFTLPGLGLSLVNAITVRDYPTVQTIILFVALLFALVNLAVDMFYAWLDPRIRYA